MADPMSEWTTALGELEREIEALETVLAGDLQDATPLQDNAIWQPSELSDRLPDALVPRAQALQTRQDAVLSGLGLALQDIRDQRTVARKVDTRASRPVYLDIQA